MKKIILCLVALVALFSCEQGIMDQTVENEDTVKISLNIPNTGSRNLANLTNPTVYYSITRDGVLYKTGSDIALDGINGVYTLDISLTAGSTYVFTKFNVLDGTTRVYELNSNNTANQAGFNIAADGSFTSATVFLKYMIGDGYTDRSAGNFTINTDYNEGSAEELTFKVTIPDGLTVRVEQLYYAPTDVYKRLDDMTDTLTDGCVVDMDAFEIYDPYNTEANLDNDGLISTRETAGNAYNTGHDDKYRFTVTEGTQSYSIYYTSAELNKNNIIFSLGQQ